MKTEQELEKSWTCMRRSEGNSGGMETAKDPLSAFGGSKLKMCYEENDMLIMMRIL